MTTPVSTSDPERLLDNSGSTSLERALLGAGSSYKSSANARARVIAGLGLAGSASLIGGSAAASGAVSTAAKVTWTKLLLGVSLVGATAVPVGYYALHRPEAPSHQAIGSVSVGSGPTTAAVQATPGDVAVAPPAAMLKEELGVLDHARTALVNGDGRRVLEELDAYDRRFPSGRLQIEAEVIRIEALAKIGRKDIARQRADLFLKRHPNSVLATRVAHIAD